ncbi:MAG: biotin/lipoyl-containing protein [Betaproteobacteria bacterium]
MALVEVKVPDIGDFKDVAVIELLVKPGDAVKVDQSLLTVESDKASMEIPSSHAGVVKELKVAVGDTVNEGSLVLMLEAAEGAAASAPVAAPAAAPAAPAPTPAQAPVQAPAPVPAAPVAVAALSAANPPNPPNPPHEPAATPALGLAHASPSVRKFARELGVPLEEVKGSGPKGRITQDDVQAFTKAVMGGSAGGLNLSLIHR